MKLSGKRTIVSMLLLSAIFAGSAAVAPSASASTYYGTPSERRIVYLTNVARHHAGLSALRYSSSLSTLARKHSLLMASQGTIFHTYNLGGVLRNFSWWLAGENVGMGPGLDVLQQAFMNSPEHRANILDPHFHRFGVGAVWKNGIVYVTVDFLS